MAIKTEEIEMLKLLEDLSDEKRIVWYWDIEDAIGSDKKSKINPEKLDDILDSLEDKGYIKTCTERGNPVAKKNQPNAEFYKIIKK